MNINTQINKISENLGTVLSGFKDDIASKATEKYVDNAISGIQVEDTRDYLCFEAVENNSTLHLDKYGNPYTVSLEYSTDKQTWYEYTWSGLSGVTITLANAGDKVYFRGDNNHFSKGTEVSETEINDFYYFIMTGKINASGNIMSLLDSKCLSKTIPDAYSFANLFYGCASLITAPELPALELKSDCYYGMFAGTKITTAPELPAYKLASGCYSSMFEGCTDLISCPRLPALEIAYSCYNSMFKKCTSLTTPPELPAILLKEMCYAYMFDHCSSLITAPELPAPELATNCYLAMFQLCTSLKYVKVAFSDFSDGTTYWLFVNPGGTLYCPSALDTSVKDYSHIPSGWDVVYTEVEEYRLSGLATEQYVDDAISGIQVEDTRDYLCFEARFANSTLRLDKVVVVLPVEAIDLEYSTDKISWTEYTWTDATGTTITLANAGDKVYFRGDNNSFSMREGYYNFVMTGGIYASGKVTSLYDKTCKSKVIPADGGFFYGLFRDCASLFTAPELPATGMRYACYTNMFRGCTHLTKTPELPATMPSDQCYQNMFYGCTVLNEVRCGSDSNASPQFTSNWLLNVAPTGTIYCKSKFDTGVRDGSYIPSGWDVVYTEVEESKLGGGGEYLPLSGGFISGSFSIRNNQWDVGFDESNILFLRDNYSSNRIQINRDETIVIGGNYNNILVNNNNGIRTVLSGNEAYVDQPHGLATTDYVSEAISTPIVDILSSETSVTLEQNKEYHHTPANDVTYMFGSGVYQTKACEWNIIVDHTNDINITWGAELITGELIGSYTPAQGDIVLYHCFWYAPSFKVKIMPVKIN